MRIHLVVVPALWLAGSAVAQSDGRGSPLDPKAKAPAVEFHSVFEDYRPFADQELGNWRRANEQVGTAGGHKGHAPGQGAGQQTSKPQPGKPESAGGRGGHQ